METRAIHDAVPVSECFTNRKLALSGEAVLLRDLSLSRPKVKNRYGAKQRFPPPSEPGADGRGAAPSSSQAMRTLRRRVCLRSIIRMRNRNHSERYADTMTSYDCPGKRIDCRFPSQGNSGNAPGCGRQKDIPRPARRQEGYNPNSVILASPEVSSVSRSANRRQRSDLGRGDQSLRRSLSRQPVGFDVQLILPRCMSCSTPELDHLFAVFQFHSQHGKEIFLVDTFDQVKTCRTTQVVQTPFHVSSNADKNFEACTCTTKLQGEPGPAVAPSQP